MKKFYNKELKSTGCPIRSGMTEGTEQGRSMVEMLGVLAVIGVLSVAGIAGYSNAMKKHRANEILNEASKRAVMVAAQAMTGKTGSISLGEFTQNTFSGVTFEGTATVADNKITLGLSGTGLADICAQLKNATGDNTVMKVTQDDCSKLTFNADMSRGSATGGNNSGSTKGNAGATEDEDGAECSGTRPGPCSVCLSTGESSGHWYDSDALCTTAGQTCVDGNCVTSAAEDPTLPDQMCKCLLTDYEDEQYYFCGGDSDYYITCSPDANDTTCARFGVWNETQGKCVVDTFCTNNGDCASDEYCHYTSVIDYPSYSPDKKGNCVKKAVAKGDFASGTSAGSEGFIRSSYTMNWFSAQNFCRSYGKNLVTLEQLGLENVLPSTKRGCWNYPGSGSPSPCQNIDATGWSAITAKFGNDYEFWTADLPPVAGRATGVDLIGNYGHEGTVALSDGYRQNNNAYHALCR